MVANNWKVNTVASTKEGDPSLPLEDLSFAAETDISPFIREEAETELERREGGRNG